jgi:hypothetical protein
MNGETYPKQQNRAFDAGIPYTEFKKTIHLIVIGRLQPSNLHKRLEKMRGKNYESENRTS